MNINFEIPLHAKAIMLCLGLNMTLQATQKCSGNYIFRVNTNHYDRIGFEFSIVALSPSSNWCDRLYVSGKSTTKQKQMMSTAAADPIVVVVVVLARTSDTRDATKREHFIDKCIKRKVKRNWTTVSLGFSTHFWKCKIL